MIIMITSHCHCNEFNKRKLGYKFICENVSIGMSYMLLLIYVIYVIYVVYVIYVIQGSNVLLLILSFKICLVVGVRNVNSLYRIWVG